MQSEFIEVVDVENILGESVIWDNRSQAVWWTDIERCLLYCYDPLNKECSNFDTPERIGSFAFTTEPDWLIVAFENGFAYFNPKKNLIKWISKPQENLSHIRFNDGRVDRQGRFWAGTMVENQDTQPEKACLYRLDQNGEPAVVLQDITISNSLCWSPDGTKLYFADSPIHRINIYDFDASKGAISNKKLFAETPEHIFPDGSVTDRDGYLWNAQWGGGRVVRYTTDGKIDHIIELPVSQPTCVTFGGADLTWLFITTAKSGLSKEQLNAEPLAGSLFIYKTDIKGIPDELVDHSIYSKSRQ